MMFSVCRYVSCFLFSSAKRRENKLAFSDTFQLQRTVAAILILSLIFYYWHNVLEAVLISRGVFECLHVIFHVELIFFVLVPYFNNNLIQFHSINSICFLCKFLGHLQVSPKTNFVFTTLGMNHSYYVGDI